MALLVFGTLLLANGHITNGLFAIATLGALVPFCYSNVFGVKRGAGSKIFMGDTGALVIGAILGLSAVNVWNMSYVAVSQPIDQLYYILAYTMLIVPCFDVIRIMLHRFRDKKPLFLPDKNHIHHKFMALGYSARQALSYIIVLNIFFVVINSLLSLIINFEYIVIIDVVIWTTIHIIITRRIEKKKIHQY